MVELMRAIAIRDGKGPSSSLFVDDTAPKPVAQPDECVVRIRAFGINRGDILQREGLYPGISHLSSILGLEFSGIVETMGQEEGQANQEWSVGDEVFGLLYGGGYAEFVAVKKRMLIAKPAELSFEQCGGLCETWFTAMQALHIVGRYNPASTRSILWHAGASAVSIAGIQLSRAAHLFASEASSSGSTVTTSPKVFATARKQEKCDFCVQELGCDGAVNTELHPDKRSWVDQIKRLNGGEGVDLVIDYIGGSVFQGNLDLLALDGAVVQLGLLDGPMTSSPVNIVAFVMKRARFEGSTLRTRDLEYQIKLRDLFVKNVLPGLVSGQFTHVVERVVPWENVAEAHGLLERNETKGKVVCVIN